jgi:hypothetical protein
VCLLLNSSVLSWQTSETNVLRTASLWMQVAASVKALVKYQSKIEEGM